MANTQVTLKSRWMIVLGFTLTAFAFGFFFSYQDEQIRFSEMSSLATSHLKYALQLKDDMALIDWAKSLEKTPSLMAFQAHLGSRLVAEGGNKQLCPVFSNDGIFFKFPSHWWIHCSFLKESTEPIDLTLIFQNQRGPLFWGLSMGGICFVLGLILIRMPTPSTKTILTTTLSTPVAVTPATAVKPVGTVLYETGIFITLDKDYVICQATPLAAKAFNQSLSDLLGQHFLDLSPDPAVMIAINEAKETKLLKPFPSHPNLLASIRPIPTGTLLILESENNSERP